MELYAEVHVLEGRLPGLVHQAVLRPLPDLQFGSTAASADLHFQDAFALSGCMAVSVRPFQCSCMPAACF